MQIYNLFIKLLKKRAKALIIYVCIFLGVMTLLIMQSEKNGESGFIEEEVKFSVFDYDQSETSKQFIEYFKEHDKYVELKKDDNEQIQDELYNRNVKCVLRIPEGFEKKIQEGKTEHLIEILGIPGTTVLSSFEGKISNYMKVLSAYIAAGESLEEASEHTKETLAITAETKVMDQKKNETYSSLYYFCLLCIYPFIGMTIEGIGPILLLLKKKEMKERIQCSSFKFTLFHLQQFLGITTTGTVIWIFFFVLGCIMCKGQFFTARGALYLLQLFCIMLVILAMAFLICKLVNKENSLSMVANIISLGICFLSGIFVPVSILGKNVIKISRFLPGYWYALGCDEIEKYTVGSDLSKIFSYIGIELLFAIVFLAVGLAISRIQYQSK